ncbi:aminotransferase class I/II-fold pyridoxal phosphate-dependent enzyme [Streptomyces sp. ODS05-4]|uniref:aminotransferase class I/II-fold pyridoxal phosphate-dependent enzyme n=1 Tax=Streptomyces sp. ODS05-4 TaxID=2944939 RepID=UPI002109F019|nr:aminotransferase class I/II-fold pyridoxal phosphate-dependent enzyme [Streptomyces sp. ODS05-4]
MPQPVTEGRGPVRYGPSPPGPASGLPVPPALADVLAAASAVDRPEPPGGGPRLLEAGCGYWRRRGMRAAPEDVAAAPGAPVLLSAVIAAHDGDLLLPRPCPAWWAPQARLLGRPAYHVPVPAECGGVPDPYALLETVRRVRGEGGRPGLLLISVADDPTGTVAPPELVREACEAAVAEGLHVVSDETWRDTLHDPHATVLVSPSEMCPHDTTVLADLSGSLAPSAWPAAIARFPSGPRGAEWRSRALDRLTALGAQLAAPVAAAAAYALGEPEPVAERAAASAALHGRVAAAAHRTVLAAGALARPPQAGRCLYADLAPLRGQLAARGVTDAMELEEYLGEGLGFPAPGGHRFGDELGALRVRLDTAPLLGRPPDPGGRALTAADPLHRPEVAEALDRLAAVFHELHRTPANGAGR